MTIENKELPNYKVEKTSYYRGWEYDLGRFGTANLVALTRNGTRIAIEDIAASEQLDVIRMLMERLDFAELCMQDEGIA